MPPTKNPPAPATVGDLRRALADLPDEARVALTDRGDPAFGRPVLSLLRLEERFGTLHIDVDFAGVEDADADDEGDAGPEVLGQIGLVGAVLLYLGRCGREGLEPRQYNAVIHGADLIMAELDRPPAEARPGMGLRAWLASDDTGLSSRAMARHLSPLVPLGVVVPGEKCRGDDAATPSDPADLGRCIRLLDAVPELRPLVPRMAEVSPAWGRLAARWDELERLYRLELPTGVGRRCYAAMLEALAGPAPPA